MIDARGIAGAGAIALVVTGAYGAYRTWPATHGTEIHLPATIDRRAADSTVARVHLTCEMIAIDVPHASPAPTEPYEAVERRGGWWTFGGDAHANARRLRGRPLYVQLTGTPPDLRATAVSDVPAANALSLAGTVTSVREDGHLRLDFAIAPIELPAGLPAGPASAVLRVLPSGRATLAGVVVNGVRY